MKNKNVWIMFLIIILTALMITQSYAGSVTTGTDTMDLKYYNNGQAAAFAIKALTTDANIMGFEFDIVYNQNFYSFDSTYLTPGAVLTANMDPLTDSYLLHADLSNINAGSVTISGARMVEIDANKGFTSASLITLVDNLKFNVFTDPITAGLNPIMVTNFVYRDKNNNPVTSNTVSIIFTLRQQTIVIMPDTYVGNGTSEIDTFLMTSDTMLEAVTISTGQQISIIADAADTLLTMVIRTNVGNMNSPGLGFVIEKKDTGIGEVNISIALPDTTSISNIQNISANSILKAEPQYFKFLIDFRIINTATGEEYSSNTNFEIRIDQRYIKNDPFIQAKLAAGVKLFWVFIKPDGSLSTDPADIIAFIPGNNFVTLPHLSQWILIELGLPPITAGVNGIIIYPNPYRPNSGNIATGVKFNGTPGSGINFNVPQENLTIEIYNINGERVTSFAATAAQIAANGNVIQWNAKNNKGVEIASGVYIALFKGESGKKYGKFAVIR